MGDFVTLTIHTPEPRRLPLYSVLRDRNPVDVHEIVGLGEYLGVPVLVVDAPGDGWLLALWPDRERPGRSHGKTKPFTYRKGEWWNLYGGQVRPCAVDFEAPSLPLMLEPKPLPTDG